MLDFRPISAEYSARATEILKKEGIENCDHCFATMLVWNSRHRIDIAITEETVFMRSFGIEHRWYLYPAGKMEKEKAINLILEDARLNNFKRSIYGIDEKGTEFLQEKFAGVFDITEDTNGGDYIYLQSDLATLPGKNYQKKRNHCSRFTRENPDYKFIRMTGENTHLAKQFEKDWCAKYDCGCDRDLSSEQKGIFALLDNFDKLDLMGAMIETGGRIVAMSVAAAITDDMVDVIVEKADRDVNGAYAIINRDFAAGCFGSFTYINREDDMGLENLKKAKMSYFPHHISKKYLAQTRKGEA